MEPPKTGAVKGIKELKLLKCSEKIIPRNWKFSVCELTREVWCLLRCSKSWVWAWPTTPSRKEKRKLAPLHSVLTHSKENSACTKHSSNTINFVLHTPSNKQPLSGFEEPKSWEYLQAPSMETPWLEGSDSQVKIRINSQNSHLSSSLPAPPLFQQLLHQDR